MSNQGYLRREIAEWAYVGLVGFALLFTTMTGASASPRTADFDRRGGGAPVACVARQTQAVARSALLCEAKTSQGPIDWFSLVGLKWAGPHAGDIPPSPPWAGPRRAD